MNKKQNNWWKVGLELFLKVSGWIAAPIVIALFVGRWLDERWQSDPWAFLGATAIAFIISLYGIVKETMRYYKQIERESKEKDNGDNK